jgi:hypothetical protein
MLPLTGERGPLSEPDLASRSDRDLADRPGGATNPAGFPGGWIGPAGGVESRFLRPRVHQVPPLPARGPGPSRRRVISGTCTAYDDDEIAEVVRLAGGKALPLHGITLTSATCSGCGCDSPWPPRSRTPKPVTSPPGQRPHLAAWPACTRRAAPAAGPPTLGLPGGQGAHANRVADHRGVIHQSGDPLYLANVQ